MTLARLLRKLTRPRPEPLDMPAPLLRLHGGFAFAGGWNPLVEGLVRGPGALAAYYERFRPADLPAFHFLDRESDVGADLPPWALPWIAWEKHRPPSAEGGLDPAEHGVSYYGPCSPQKVAFEHHRLSALRDSIERHGYRPDRYGHITGFLMLRGDAVRFFVRGGKHRAAVLAALGHPTVPVTMKPDWPPLVNRDQAAQWPLVAEGRISLDLALAVFDRYFDTDGRHQAAELGLIGGG